MTRVLIIDDEESICWGLEKLCEQMSLGTETASSAERGLELASKTQFDLVIMDVRLPGIDGITAIEKLQQVLGKVPVITITAFGDLKTAIDAIHKGAFEYIVKPFDLEKVRSTISQAITTRNLLENVQHPEEVEDQVDRSGMIGASAVMQEVFKQIALTTTSESPVLITGESGTGKEITARSIHQFSSRSSQPFVAVNIAALNPSLAESELFGHVKGAFTGAESDRTGLIQKAHGGTLFLDEVAEIPLEIQVKLLRVLDQGEVLPVGSNQPIKTDFRLISATNQDVLSQINHGDFRQDLFYRLRTFEIKLPPLRQRMEDIPELVHYFLRKSSPQTNISIQQDFVDELKSRNWPGNIRELQSVVERAAILARGGLLTAEHIPKEPSDAPNINHSQGLQQKIHVAIAEWTRQHWPDQSSDDLYEQLITLIEPAILQTAFHLSENQYSAAARRLGIHRTTLKKKLAELGNLDSESKKQ
jgi:two-component system nitrogen regulation response regulator GlnG